MGKVYSAPLLYSSPYDLPALILKTDACGVYYDNTDSAFAVFSYSDFLRMVNAAITVVCQSASIAPPFSFFKYDPVMEKISYYSPTMSPGALYFSINLHPYIGEAFDTNWYFLKPPLINDDVFSIIVEGDARIQIIETIGGIPFIRTIQEYKAMSSWASINRILFVSNKLPIKKEYYPIIGSNSEINSPQAAYESLVSMNIICSFLFASTDAGDFRTNIVYSSATVDSADLIEMPLSGQVREIDIEVYWSDKNGHVFQLRLGPNKQVNLRLAFVKSI